MGVHRMIWRGGTRVLLIGSACLWLVLGACGEDAITPPVGPVDQDTLISAAPDTVVAGPVVHGHDQHAGGD